MKQTAIEQLIHWIESDCTPMDCVMKAKELLKIEKKQIIDAYANGHNDGCRYMTNEKQEFEHGEQYYKETYKSE